MNIKKVLEDINRAPTMMDGKQELEFMEKLANVKVNDIVSNIGDFFEILDRLDESHSNNGYFEVTQENKEKYLGFSDWIVGLTNKDSHLHRREDDLLSYASTFRLLPWDVCNKGV